MHLRVAVDLAGAGLEDRGPGGGRMLEQVQGAQHARLQRVDRVALILRRRGGAGEIVDLVDFHMLRQGLDDVARGRGSDRPRADGRCCGHSRFGSCRGRERDGAGQQGLAQMRADEAGTAGDEDPPHGPAAHPALHVHDPVPTAARRPCRRADASRCASSSRAPPRCDPPARGLGRRCPRRGAAPLEGRAGCVPRNRPLGEQDLLARTRKGLQPSHTSLITGTRRPRPRTAAPRATSRPPCRHG